MWLVGKFTNNIICYGLINTCLAVVLACLQACTGSDAYKNKNRVDSLSTSWSLPGTSKMTLFRICDREIEC